MAISSSRCSLPNAGTEGFDWLVSGVVRFRYRPFVACGALISGSPRKQRCFALAGYAVTVTFFRLTVMRRLRRFVGRRLFGWGLGSSKPFLSRAGTKQGLRHESLRDRCRDGTSWDRFWRVLVMVTFSIAFVAAGVIAMLSSLYGKALDHLPKREPQARPA
jgi:hypothetical protein